MISNTIQVIYRLSDKLVLMWPVRPNVSSVMIPDSYNVYWAAAAGGPFVALLGSVVNGSCDVNGNRSFHNKVVMYVTPSMVPGWNNDVSNYVAMKPVVGVVLQPLETVTIIPPYTRNGMRLHYPELRTTAIVGYDEAEGKFVPVAVDGTGKVRTI